MYLSELELFGFKSFAQKTRLKFNEGISCVIGPNGSGKSNIVDAIRWVLGEQKVNTLRSDKMESVIFNGTRTRKALGMAEVSLTIQNTKNVLNSPFSEVEISRRLYRSGESQYLINKTPCRLKDILNLFMDTGLNANSYSVIELKMVENIISENASDRRMLFEEAAGVTKYKVRRKSALKKLENTQQDMSRISDLIGEISRTVNSLSRQVGKARRYLKLQDELKTTEIELSRYKYNKLLDEISPLEKQLQEINLIKKDTTHQITLEEALVEEYKRELVDFEQKLVLYNNQLSKIDGEIQQIKKDDAVADAKKESMQLSLQRFDSDIKEYQQKIVDSKTEIETAAQMISQLQEIVEEMQLEFNNKQSEYELAQSNLEEQKHAIEELNNVFIQKSDKHNQSAEQLRKIQFDIEWNTKQYEELSQQNKMLAQSIKESESIMKDSETAKQKLSNQIDETKSKISETENEIKVTAQKSEELIENIRSVKSKIESVQSQIEFYTHIISAYEGHTDSIKKIMEKKAEFPGIHGILSEMINSKKEHATAIEAALGNAINYLIVDSVSDARSVIDFCKKNKLGKVSIIPLERLSELAAIETDTSIPYPSIAGLVNSPQKYKKIFDILLNRIYLVDDFDKAIEASAKHTSARFVTTNGEQINLQFEFTSAEEKSEQNLLVGRAQQLEKLQKDFLAANEKLIALEKEFSALQKQKNDFENKLTKLTEQLNFTREQLTNTEKDGSQLIFETENKNKTIQLNSDKINSIKTNLEQLNVSQSEVQTNLSKLKSEKDESEKNLIAQTKDFDRQNEELQQDFAQVQDIRIKLANKQNELHNQQQALNRLENSISDYETTIKNRTNEIVEINSQLGRFEQEKISRNEQLGKLWEQRDKLESEKSKYETQYHELKDKILHLDNQIKKYRKQHDSTIERTKQLELNIKENQVRAENIKERIFEEYKEDISIGIPYEGIDTQEYEQNIESLKFKIKNLGQVNPLAVSEYDKEKERLDFYQKQFDDLKKAEKSLNDTITKINKTAREQFVSTFEAIKTNFEKIFINFFQNGEGTLKLDENEDPLEANIEIYVRPKGKKLQTLSLLSGGEKTLTAITLLFAIYLVKPSPFCILDEVDAPLDDVNITRFTDALGDFSKNTQFIVVTHNKRTMEAADSLYGVTMEEEGLSKLVSVKFN